MWKAVSTNVWPNYCLIEFKSIRFICLNSTTQSTLRANRTHLWFRALQLSSLHNLTLWEKNPTFWGIYSPAIWHLEIISCRVLFVCSNNIWWIFWSRFVRTGDFSVDITNFSSHPIFTISCFLGSLSPHVWRVNQLTIKLNLGQF